jgi:hypothetical protein
VWLALAATCLVVGVLLLVMASLIAPFYLGTSGHAEGVLVTSGDEPATITYIVEGEVYSIAASRRGDSRSTNDHVTVMYNPRHPEQAATVEDRAVSVLFGGAGLLLAPVGAAGCVRALRGRR